MFIRSIQYISILMIISAFNTYAKEWIQVDGKGYPLCDDLFRKIQKYKSTKADCATPLMENHPELAEMPWSKVEDAKEHKGLLYELAMYRHGSRSYFTQKFTSPYQEEMIKKDANKTVQTQLDNNVQLQFVRVPLPESLSSLKELHPALEGALNFVRIIDPTYRPKEACNGYSIEIGLPKIFLLNDTLTGPDPRLDTKKYGFRGIRFATFNRVGYLYMYQEEIHAFEAGPSGIWIKNANDSAPYSNHFCHIDSPKPYQFYQDL